LKKKVVAEMPDDLITLNDAARLRGYSDSSAVSQLIRRGYIRRFEMYGKPLVSRSEVENYVPTKPGPKPKEEAEKSAARKRVRKKDPTRLLKTLS
jgi:hypothetical protein